MLFRRNNHEEEHNFWMSYTDLMSGFLIVFIIISVVMYVNYQKEIRQNKELNEAIKEAKLDKDELDRLLTEYKKNDLRNVIDEYKGTIRPTESIDVDFSKDRGSIIITSKYGELFAAGEPKGDYLTVPDDFSRSVAWFPFVGLLGGVLMGVANWYLTKWLVPDFLRAVLLLVWELLCLGIC